MSASEGVPVTVTASLKPSVIVMVSPLSAIPVPGEADASVTVGARFTGVVGDVGVVGVVGAVGADAGPVVMSKFLKFAVIASGAGPR